MKLSESQLKIIESSLDQGLMSSVLDINIQAVKEQLLHVAQIYKLLERAPLFDFDRPAQETTTALQNFMLAWWNDENQQVELNPFFKLNNKHAKLRDQISLNDKYLVVSAYALIMICQLTQDMFARKGGEVEKFESPIERSQDYLTQCFKAIYSVRILQCATLVQRVRTEL